MFTYFSRSGTYEIVPIPLVKSNNRNSEYISGERLYLINIDKTKEACPEGGSSDSFTSLWDSGFATISGTNSILDVWQNLDVYTSAFGTTLRWVIFTRINFYEFHEFWPCSRELKFAKNLRNSNSQIYVLVKHLKLANLQK